MVDSFLPGPVRIGTSGWNYPEWRGKFYPEKLARTKELTYAASQLNTLEINSSFYRLMLPSTYRKWGCETPDGFQFAVKGWRQITHYSRLKNVGKPVADFLGSGVLGLEQKLGPLLWQLPPSLQFDAAVVEDFLALLPRTMGEARNQAASATQTGARPSSTTPDRYPSLPPAPDDQPIFHALEPRSQGFGSPAAIELLRKYNVALVVADTAGRYPQFDQVTAELIYVRLHGSPRLYFSNYSESQLDQWAASVRRWRATGHSVYFYFDNTGAGHAPVNARQLAHLVGD